MSKDETPTEPPVTREEIAQNERDGKLLNASKDPTILIKLLLANGGYGEIRTHKQLAYALYGEQPTQNRHAVRQSENTDKTYGDNRLSNLFRGGKLYSPREAQFFHSGITEVLGAEVAKAISPEDLVRLPKAKLFNRIVSTGLPWDDDLAPYVVLQILALAFNNSDMSIRPFNPLTGRLGVVPGSRNADLRPLDPIPRMAVGQEYLLQLASIPENLRQLLVFEVSDDELSKEGCNESLAGFPICSGSIKKISLTLRPDDKDSYVIADSPGSFAFYALAFPESVNIPEQFGLDLSTDRWSLNEMKTFTRKLKAWMTDHPNEFAVANYLYRVG